MTPIITLINGQDLNFDDHSRAIEQHNLEYLHMHKRFHKDKYSKAEIRIFFNEYSTWDVKGPRADELRRELRDVFERLTPGEQAKFFQQVVNALSEYYRSLKESRDKNIFLDRIVAAIWGGEFHVLRSNGFNNFKIKYSKSFGIDSNDDELKYYCQGKKFKIIFHKNGKIEIQDISNEE